MRCRPNLRVRDERPFVPCYLPGSVPPIGKRKAVFPKDLGELCLATAWRLVQDGQSVLVFCPVRAHVAPFADRIIDLHRRGASPSLLTVDPAILDTALVLGVEWLGADHPILQCLRLGVAIHHGALITWTGRLAADEFDQFGMALKLPDAPGARYFPTTQRCATGVNAWTAIPASPEQWHATPMPAPMLTSAGSDAHLT